MKSKLRQEWQQLVNVIKQLDKQTMFVLTMSGFLIVLQFNLGSRSFFRKEIAPFIASDALHGLLSWGWWFTIQGITGFVIPVLCLLFIFKRRPQEIGLGLGDWKLATLLAACYLPLVGIGTWILSDNPDFQSHYPHFHQAAFDWTYFFIYELLFLFYWIGWEYLWRGFMLFGTAHTFGVMAIFVQMLPFAAMHVEKPMPEALLSVVGGIALGGLVWRCRSFWIAVPIHAAQMFILDFWCTLRQRTGVSGVGLSDLLEMLEKWMNSNL